MSLLKRLWNWMQRDNRFGVDPLTPIYPAVTPDPDATKALELAWERRRQELDGWQPTNGFLADRVPEDLQ